MILYIIRRILLTIPTIFVISLITLVIIQLPPDSWLDAHISLLMAEGQQIDEEEIEWQAIRAQGAGGRARRARRHSGRPHPPRCGPTRAVRCRRR